MKLITLENELPVFNPEVRMIREFNDLLVRDKGSKGDADGRKKYIAIKELTYVHFMAYYNSEFIASYSEEERPKRIKESIGLPTDWKPDAKVELAVLKYKELNSTPTMDSLTETKESLFSANKIIKLLRRRLESKLQDLENVMQTSTDEDVEKTISKTLEDTMKMYDQIMKTAEKMPVTVETITKLEERIRKEMEKEKIGKKGIQISDWEV